MAPALTEKEIPAAKRAKTNQDAEVDATEDTRSKNTAPIVFNVASTTLNVIPTMGGNVLTSLSEGAMEHLIAGAKANVAVSAGRYMFEVRVLERLGQAKRVIKVGFSTAETSLFGDGTGGVFVDCDAYFPAQGLDCVIAVVLNLDASTSNPNTLSLFKDGVRICSPLSLPAAVHGMPLLPHVVFRGVTTMFNFGPTPKTALPFSCHMLQSAASTDVTIQTVAPPADGKYDVVFPVGLPDEMTFQWLDKFLVDNPSYTELSDRKIIDWAVKSGIRRNMVRSTSNDKPEATFNIPALDNFSVRSVVAAMAPTKPRHYVVMEVKENLIPQDRISKLKLFSAPMFRKVAKVLMGNPGAEYVGETHSKLLLDKQHELDAEFKTKKLADARRKELERIAEARRKEQERQQKEVEDRRKANEEAKRAVLEAAKKRAAEAKKKVADAKKAQEEARKAAEEDAKKQDEASKAETDENADAAPKAAAGDAMDTTEENKAEVKDEEMAEVKEEPVEETKEDPAEPKEEATQVPKEELDEEPKEESKQEPKDEPADEFKEETPEVEEVPPQAELTDLELKTIFYPNDIPDITELVFAENFLKFSIPLKEEGFDDISFELQDEVLATGYMQQWMRERKLSTRLRGLEPADWFRTQYAEWQGTVRTWRTTKSRGPAKPADDDEGANPPVAIDDVYSVEDVCDVGGGRPLFDQFKAEDWAMLTLRYELCLLTQIFKRDVADDELFGIPLDHVAFYYNKFFKKPLSARAYGKEDMTALCGMVKDTVLVESVEGFLVSALPDGDEPNLELLLKHTEHARETRQRWMDAGDETMKLQLTAIVLTGDALIPRAGAGQVHRPVLQTRIATQTASHGVVGRVATGLKGAGKVVGGGFAKVM